MPSPRQILSDITEMGLDPACAYTQTSTAGSLRPNVSEDVQAVVEQAVSRVLQTKKDVEVKNALTEVQPLEDKKKEKKSSKKVEVLEEAKTSTEDKQVVDVEKTSEAS